MTQLGHPRRDGGGGRVVGAVRQVVDSMGDDGLIDGTIRVEDSSLIGRTGR